jgi:hypothetical protein
VIIWTPTGKYPRIPTTEKFSPKAQELLTAHLYEQARQIQSMDSLFMRAVEFLKEHRYLNPSDYNIERLIKTQREKARTASYTEVARVITPEIKTALDELLVVDGPYSNTLADINQRLAAEHRTLQSYPAHNRT